ncbi:hypothetical protein FGG78_17360 [Thioclava sp. BHET1]|nr:hypothetical protein FGG78_17360 [Thioclava sp. BHET1]
MIPQVIHALWNTGWDSAPALVKQTRASWQRHAPNFTVNALEADGLAHHLAELGLGDRKIPIQAASDILRTKLLYEQGGLWLDATCLLVAPLEDWLPQRVAPSGFFAFAHPGTDRLISNWCLAAEPRSEILGLLLKTLCAYWSRDREIFNGFSGIARWNIPARKARAHALRDPLWAVSQAGYAKTRFAPYFCYHYLFEAQIQQDPASAEIWRKTPRVSAVPAHVLGQIAQFGGIHELSDGDLGQIRAISPLHKLNWRLDFPDQIFA